MLFKILFILLETIPVGVHSGEISNKSTGYSEEKQLLGEVQQAIYLYWFES